jgi:hypothetical protein
MRSFERNTSIHNEIGEDRRWCGMCRPQDGLYVVEG